MVAHPRFFFGGEGYKKCLKWEDPFAVGITQTQSSTLNLPHIITSLQKIMVFIVRICQTYIEEYDSPPK